jgi:hypothetical protein
MYVNSNKFYIQVFRPESKMKDEEGPAYKISKVRTHVVLHEEPHIIGVCTQALDSGEHSQTACK